MANILIKLLESIPQLVNEFAKILTMSPVQGILLVVGGLLLAFSIIVMGYLTLGALFRPVGGLAQPQGGQQNQ
jgi:membrane-bound ClpP family serine protease